MKNIRYMIHTLSAKTVMSFSKENEDGSYSFQLSQNETDKCKLNRNYLLQDDMPICFQAMCIPNTDLLAFHQGRVGASL